MLSTHCTLNRTKFSSLFRLLSFFPIVVSSFPGLPFFLPYSSVAEALAGVLSPVLQMRSDKREEKSLGCFDAE